MTEHPVPRRIKPLVTALTVLFCAAMFIAIMRGGMCERYERKMLRQDLMRHYIDSVRSEEQLRKAREAEGRP